MGLFGFLMGLGLRTTQAREAQVEQSESVEKLYSVTELFAISAKDKTL